MHTSYFTLMTAWQYTTMQKGHLHQLDHYFMMKKGLIGDLNVYLGSRLHKVTLENGVEAWVLSPSKYVQEAIWNVEEYLGSNFGG